MDGQFCGRHPFLILRLSAEEQVMSNNTYVNSTSTENLKATHEGILKVGELQIPCYVLSTGNRVLSLRDFLRTFTRIS